MNLSRKIEEIRQKPEHIRMRYVWAAVTISMFLVILIWIFSFKNTFNSGSSDKVTLPDLKSAYESSKQELPSIQSFIDKNTTANGSEEGAVNNSDNSNQPDSSQVNPSPTEGNSSNSTPGQ